MTRLIHPWRALRQVFIARVGVCLSLLVGLASTAAPGCVAGSLASSTGPRPDGFSWSTASRQQVHLGETVTFDFVLTTVTGRRVDPAGLIDYVIATIGSTPTRAVGRAEGRFQFTHDFTSDVTPGDHVTVRVDAYRQRGSRDFVDVRGRWFRGQSPLDEADRVVASDAITLTVYQTRIALRLPRPADDLDPETGVLRLRRSDGTTTAVYLDRPNRPGFLLDGPQPDGYYRVRYRPRGDEVNPTGSTPVTFVIYDRAGDPHHVSASLPTP